MLERLRRFVLMGDWMLTISLVFLLLLSLSALYASGKSSDIAYTNFIQQVMFVVTGLIIYLIVSVLDFRQYRSWSIWLYGIAIVSLIAVLFFGSEIRSTTGWFRIGDYGIQPIEFVKVAWILMMATFILSKGKDMSKWKNILILAGFMFALIGLTLLQPDLGSAIIVLAVTLGVMFITNIKRYHILTVAVLLIVVFLISWFFLLQEYQKERILVLFNSARDPLGGGYHVTQSIIAIGSGGWFGRGLGFGSQSQLKFLPEQQTDFIFAVIGEELGLVGAGLVIVLFGVLLYRILRIAWKSSTPYGTYIAFGIMLLFFVQIMINIGMNLGLLPVAGIPLPFVSYGGSSMLAMMIAIGIVQSIAIYGKK